MPLPVVPSVGLQAGFLVLALALGMWWAYAAGRASLPSDGVGWSPRRAAVALAAFFVWFAFLFGVSQASWMHEFDSFPPPGMRVVMLLIVITIVIAFSPVGRRLAEGVPMIWLVGFQVFRLPTELLIHQAANDGLAPIEMTYEGSNFDILTAVLALALVLMMRKGAVSPKLLLGWNLLGLFLLLNVVITAIMAMPHPLQLLDTSPPNVWVTYFPFVLLPGVLVCSALLGHLLVFRALRLKR